MQGKILIIDQLSTNRIVLKVKLAAAFYDVLQAATMAEALEIAQSTDLNLIISALTLPDGSAAELAKALTRLGPTLRIPVMVCDTDIPQHDRLDALGAGVQEIMNRPINEPLLLARVRSLIRAQNTTAEWQMRDDTSRALGFAESASLFEAPTKVQIISRDMLAARDWSAMLRAHTRAKIGHSHPDTALRDITPDHQPDVFLIALPADEQKTDASLRLLSSIRATAATRHAGLMVLQPHKDPAIGAYALDLGADDLMTDGFEPTEAAIRIKALIARKRIADRLRDTVRTGIKAAISDPLTGLHNRRYAMPHLARIAEHSIASGRPFAVMLADLDHFKRINDHYGHASGDAVLIETARRLRQNLRAVDLVARIGGEEFLIVMPATSINEARIAASRLCNLMSEHGFVVPGSKTPIAVTISIGLAIGGLLPVGARFETPDAEHLVQAADKALYAAKNRGRNQFILSRPAA